MKNLNGTSITAKLKVTLKEVAKNATNVLKIYTFNLE